MTKHLNILLLLFILPATFFAQNKTISGHITDSISGQAIEKAFIIIDNNPTYSAETDDKGFFEIKNVRANSKSATIMKEGYATREIALSKINGDFTFKLTPLKIDLKEITIEEKRNETDIERMRSIEGTAIYKGMKNEVLYLDKMNVNTSTNNSRQTYAKVPGINSWESDGAGIQLGIGARGLSPNRTSHFNVRQNLYDISADALGYPESYYTPPLAGVERIEIVRGASALQYGTQFGGLLNFKMKKGNSEKKLEVKLRQSAGSYGINDSITPVISSFTSFLSVGGSTDNLNYYVFYQLKTGKGWRKNSDYDVHTAYFFLKWAVSEKFSITVDGTHMNYLAQQPGGLTDADFNNDPRASFRNRNWFSVDWNMASLKANYSLSPLTEISSVTFGLLASRKALGFLGQTQRPDPLEERDLIASYFKNIGNETRIIHRVKLKERFWVLTGGVRLYSGFSHAQQGLANALDTPDFEFLNQSNLEGSDYEFPNKNLAVFHQSIVPITAQLSLTPGIRYEWIDTRSDGSFRNIVYDGAGNPIEDTTLFAQTARKRGLVLVGSGVSYQKENIELYGNIVQNYRAINFTDIQIKNTSLVIDPDLQDELGYNADVGIRGEWGKNISFDISAFALVYNNRIGEYFTVFSDNKPVRYRTNIANARNLGVEFFAETELLRFWKKDPSKNSLKWFVNTTVIDAKYVDSEVSAFHNKKVELVPEFTLKTGLNWTGKKLSAGVLYSLIGEQFSDATNVGSDPNFPATQNAVDGIIPQYQVIDITVNYAWKHGSVFCSVNNLLNASYFTRRASGYPGPGIIPSDGRSFNIGVEIQL